jgi:tetratricopeptide (TPR) repeat protein
LALILDEEGAHEDSMDAQTRALEIAEATRAGDHRDLAAALLGIGAAHQARGEIERARSEFARSLQILETTLEPSNPAIADPLVRLCMIEINLDQRVDARQHCQRALDLREAAYGAEHYLTATPSVLLGLILRREGDLVGARARLEHGYQVLGRNSGFGNYSEIIPLFELTELDLAEGLLDAALDRANEALRVSEGNLVKGVCSGQALFLRARVLAATPELAKLARGVAEDAREQLVLDGRFPAELARVDAWLDEPQH